MPARCGFPRSYKILHTIHNFLNLILGIEWTISCAKQLLSYLSPTSAHLYRYRNLLQPAERFGRKRGLYTGLGSGFNCMLTNSLTTIALIYGTRLVVEDFAKPTDEKTYKAGNIFTVRKIFCFQLFNV